MDRNPYILIINKFLWLLITLNFIFPIFSNYAQKYMCFGFSHQTLN